MGWYIWGGWGCFKEIPGLSGQTRGFNKVWNAKSVRSSKNEANVTLHNDGVRVMCIGACCTMDVNGIHTGRSGEALI